MRRSAGSSGLALAAPALVALVLALGCSERPLTQIVVVSDTDLAVGPQVDAISIAIEPPTGLTSVQRGALVGEGMITLPATLGVVHRDGPLGPVRVIATAHHGDDVVVTREAVLEFVPGRTLTLVLPLEAACRDIACGDDETCAEGACRPVQITRDELLPFDGTTPRLEAGMPCTPELCNEFDDDCDGRVDETFDLRNSPDDCGACGVVCPARPGGVPACVDGECSVACGEGFGDCDGDVRNGCEVSLNSLTMCGQCEEACEIAHGTPTCFTGTCEAMSCAPGWGDCSNGVDDGCESPLDTPEHCGDCDTPCAPANATPSCAGGLCVIATCHAGFDDCDPAIEGCERAITTISDCGGCDQACPDVENGSPACVEGRCAIGACGAGFGDCNGDPRDGCETPLTTTSDCLACGTPCTLAHAVEMCAAGGCAIASCSPGWADCNGTAADGCERSLETSTDCGACDAGCAWPTPLCGTATGTRACESTCTATEMICGAACIDVTSSLAHCGGCDTVCAPPNATPACTGGACTIAACDPGFGDCDGAAANGCETPLDTLTDCGACDVACDLAGASEMCLGGRCQISMCEPLRANCDGSPANGCETAIDTVAACGGCSRVCDLPNAVEACAAGECAIASCESGFADCDGMVANGCETALGTLADCGACDDACSLAHASEICDAGACEVAVCDDEFGDCNGIASDGCETSLRTPSTCGTCTNACPMLPHATSTCGTGTCDLDRCQPLWGDCDGMASTGCEQSLEVVAHCGGCNVACVVGGAGGATATCTGGTCAVSCSRTDRLDCNGNPADGCEGRILNDARNCGACGVVCPAGQSCTGGVCG